MGPAVYQEVRVLITITDIRVPAMAKGIAVIGRIVKTQAAEGAAAAVKADAQTEALMSAI
jgi:hypothetical protein